jgi:hypothetical protein
LPEQLPLLVPGPPLVWVWPLAPERLLPLPEPLVPQGERLAGLRGLYERSFQSFWASWPQVVVRAGVWVRGVVRLVLVPFRA